MNAPHKLPTSATYECVRDSFYVMTTDDLDEGSWVVMDADSGRQWGLKRGRKVMLYVPLCDGCDQPIEPSGCCHDCCLLHSDVAGLSA